MALFTRKAWTAKEEQRLREFIRTCHVELGWTPTQIANEFHKEFDRSPGSVYQKLLSELGIKKDKRVTKPESKSKATPKPKIGELSDLFEEGVKSLREQAEGVIAQCDSMLKGVEELRSLEQWAVSTLAIRSKINGHIVDARGVVVKVDTKPAE